MSITRMPKDDGGRKVFCAIVLVICVMFLIFSWLRDIYFDINCSAYLSRAAQSSTTEMASTELGHALDYLEENRLTHGNTGLIFNGPENDIGFWYNNLKASRQEMMDLPKTSSQLERTNILLKLRETITHSRPEGLAFYPGRWGYVIGGVLSVLFGFIAFANLIAKKY